VAVVSFDATDDVLAQAYLQGPQGESDYAISGDVALIALILRDPHLGCLNKFCESSQWWENPCHGDHYNRIGEHQGGPSPRGLDRYPTQIADGHLLISLARVIVGPPPEASVDDQPPAGPHCVG
jgi:cytochrome b6-f complex iron-sulfur subunit